MPADRWVPDSQRPATAKVLSCRGCPIQMVLNFLCSSCAAALRELCLEASCYTHPFLPIPTDITHLARLESLDVEVMGISAVSESASLLTRLTCLSVQRPAWGEAWGDGRESDSRDRMFDWPVRLPAALPLLTRLQRLRAAALNPTP